MLKVNDVMSEKVFAFQEGQSINSVCRLMILENIRHIPVVDKEYRFKGMLTHREIMAKMATRFSLDNGSSLIQFSDYINVANIMNKDVRTFAPGMSLEEAIMIFVDEKLECVPVVSGGLVVGVVTETDLFPVTCRMITENPNKIWKHLSFRDIA